MSDLILISYYWVNSATHFNIRPQNINNKSMLKTELDPISPQISTLAFIFLCFFLSCYPHFHLFSFLSCFFFYSFFPVTFLPVTFFPPHCYFFSGAKLLLFFLFLYLHPDCYLFSCYFFSYPKLLLFFLLPFFLLLSFQAPTGRPLILHTPHTCKLCLFCI